MAIVGGALLVLGGFLAGSIPWGLVLGRAFSGVDIRQHGSKSTGTTNALRVLGWRISLAVFLLDFLKGLLPVVVARLVGVDDWVVGLTAVATVIGHCWSPWISFKGGKGMATGGGAALGLAPWLLLLAPVMVVVVWLTRYVSLGSLTTTLSAVIVAGVAAGLGWLSWAWVAAVAAIALIVVLRHQSNIQRLLSGTERRFGERVAGTQ